MQLKIQISLSLSPAPFLSSFFLCLLLFSHPSLSLSLPNPSSSLSAPALGYCGRRNYGPLPSAKIERCEKQSRAETPSYRHHIIFKRRTLGAFNTHALFFSSSFFRGALRPQKQCDLSGTGGERDGEWEPRATSVFTQFLSSDTHASATFVVLYVHGNQKAR